MMGLTLSPSYWLVLGIERQIASEHARQSGWLRYGGPREAAIIVGPPGCAGQRCPGCGDQCLDERHGLCLVCADEVGP